MERHRLRLRTRLAAWLVCGPVAHLCCGAADVASGLARLAWERARGRDPWA